MKFASSVIIIAIVSLYWKLVDKYIVNCAISVDNNGNEIIMAITIEMGC